MPGQRAPRGRDETAHVRRRVPIRGVHGHVRQAHLRPPQSRHRGRARCHVSYSCACRPSPLPKYVDSVVELTSYVRRSAGWRRRWLLSRVRGPRKSAYLQSLVYSRSPIDINSSHRTHRQLKKHHMYVTNVTSSVATPTTPATHVRTVIKSELDPMYVLAAGASLFAPI